jgi:hypothetical protein
MHPRKATIEGDNESEMKGDHCLTVSIGAEKFGTASRNTP